MTRNPPRAKVILSANQMLLAPDHLAMADCGFFEIQGPGRSKPSFVAAFGFSYFDFAENTTSRQNRKQVCILPSAFRTLAAP